MLFGSLLRLSHPAKEIKAAKDTLNQIINNAEYVNDFITLDPAQGAALDCKVKT